MTHQTTLIDRFTRRNAHVAVIGLGYVGLPLAVAFAEAGYRVTGIDLDARNVLATCDAVSICVPTPLNKTGDPDVSYIGSGTPAGNGCDGIAADR